VVVVETDTWRYFFILEEKGGWYVKRRDSVHYILLSGLHFHDPKRYKNTHIHAFVGPASEAKLKASTGICIPVALSN
jgi:hypothetical protein